MAAPSVPSTGLGTTPLALKGSPGSLPITRVLLKSRYLEVAPNVHLGPVSPLLSESSQATVVVSHHVGGVCRRGVGVC